jgi:hypothetical protein
MQKKVNKMGLRSEYDLRDVQVLIRVKKINAKVHLVTQIYQMFRRVSLKK